MSAGLPTAMPGPAHALHRMSSHVIAQVEHLPTRHKLPHIHDFDHEFGGAGTDFFLLGTVARPHLRQTAAVNNYAVVTITNTTNTGVNFLISAFPFESGRFIPVSLAAA